MNKIFDKDLLLSALKRAVWTFLQSVLGMLTVGVAVTEFDWKSIVLVSITAAIISFLKSMVVGTPEASTEGTLMIDTTDPDKDYYLMSFDSDLEDFKSRKTVVFKVDPEARLNDDK